MFFPYLLSIFIDIRDYQNCNLTKKGNIFNWATDMDTKLEISYLNTTDEERRKLCEKSPTYYVPLGKELKNKVTFEEGLEFCENIGGEMAVIGRLNFVHFNF